MKACIETNYGITKYFNCQTGICQGRSALYYSPCTYYKIAQVYLQWNITKCHNVNVCRLPSDVYRDTAGRLQQMISVLDTFCKEWKLEVQLTTTNVLVCRRGGTLRGNEKWFFINTKIEKLSQSHFKYMGLLIIISPTLSWWKAVSV